MDLLFVLSLSKYLRPLVSMWRLHLNLPPGAPVFTLNFLPYRPTGPVSSNIYRPIINSTGPNLKTALMTISSNHQNSKHDDVPNIMWTCIYQLCIREDQNASKKTDTLFWIHVYINLLKILKSYCQ